jgi:putative PIN family toxin of toxin-antitoxin system
VNERWKVFLDTNVFIAGLVSKTGASAAILDLGESEEIRIVLSQQIIVEADRTFQKKFPHLISQFRAFIKNLAPLFVKDPPITEVREAEKKIHVNDAPILAVAKRERIDYLVTLNTRHFITPKACSYLAKPIVTPAEFLTAFRKFWENPE